MGSECHACKVQLDFRMALDRQVVLGWGSARVPGFGRGMGKKRCLGGKNPPSTLSSKSAFLQQMRDKRESNLLISAELSKAEPLVVSRVSPPDCSVGAEESPVTVPE